MSNFLKEAKELFPYTQSLRRDFHIHPELGFNEIRTGGIVAKELETLGIEVTKGVGKTGIVGLLEGAKPGPTVLIRFDMDALPITEETGVEYASQNSGVMHACGHDGHTAIGLTVAKILHAHRNELSGTVKFVFQPAEEGTCGEEVGGAETMIRDGVLENPKPDFALSMHLWNENPLGWVNVAAGPVMAGVEHFKVRVTGKGGHAAIPDQAVDPVVTASQIITAIQSITSRNVSPLDAAVVSVTMVHGGSAFNVIPKDVELEGTIRTFNSMVREKVVRRFEEVSRGVGEALGCKVDLNVKKLSPAMINDEKVAARVQEVARRVLPDANHNADKFVTMGGEDMAFMLEKIPGCYFFVGSNNSSHGLDYGHHHPKFDFDEGALWRGAGLMAAAAAEILS
jgi:amidohydrolase